MLPFDSDFLASILAHDPCSLSYTAGRRIAAMRPGRAVLETDSASFDVADALARGGLDGALLAHVHAQLLRRYDESSPELDTYPENAVFELSFDGCRFEVIVITYQSGDYGETRKFVVGPDQAAAEALVRHVCAFDAQAASEVLVFEHGTFKKDETLFEAVRHVELDALVLRGSLKADILADVRGFLRARHVYERYGVPYKRGILLYGPPGNGKTHFLKGLIASIDAPCLYVKSLLTSSHNDHESARRIFARARSVAPCLLVFEDLDSLLSDQNRSYFLNELDGFAENTGVVVLATTNHPERIDPAIIDRPSRFDRKYLFDLPASEERQAFLARWSERLEPEMRASADVIERLASSTSGFSFAYLKELTLSATMAWVHDAAPGGMDSALLSVLGTLKEQVQKGKSPGQGRSGRRVGLVPEA